MVTWIWIYVTTASCLFITHPDEFEGVPDAHPPPRGGGHGGGVAEARVHPAHVGVGELEALVHAAVVRARHLGVLNSPPCSSSRPAGPCTRSGCPSRPPSPAAASTGAAATCLATDTGFPSSFSLSMLPHGIFCFSGLQLGPACSSSSRNQSQCRLSHDK